MKKLKIPIYDQTILFFDSDKDIYKFCKKEKRELTCHHAESIEGCVGQVGILPKETLPNGEQVGDLYMLVSDKSINTVIHESVHAALYLCNHIGITVDIENQEPYAYLSAYIATQYIKMYNLLPKELQGD